MAADSSSYDAGTATLTIEAQLDPDFEAKLAAQLAAVPPMPVALTADLDQFAKDLDKAWGDLDHKLRVQLEPVTDGQALGEGLEPVKVQAVLDTAEAEAKLREFFSLIPIYTIPAMLDTTVAEAQLADLRAKAAEPLTIPVRVAHDDTGAVQHGMAQDAGANRRSAEEILYNAARQNPQMAAEEIVGTAASHAPQAAEQVLNTNAGQQRSQPTSSGANIDRILARMEKEDRDRIASGYKDAVAESAAREKARTQAEEEARKNQPISGMKALTNFFGAVDKDVSLGNILKALPQLGGSESWVKLLGGLKGGAGGAAGASEGLEALSAAAGPIAAGASAVVEGFTTVGSAVAEFAEKASEAALKVGAIGLAGGLLADLGAIGVTGMVGLHHVPEALQAGQALHDWQIDPNAQLQHKSEVLSAQQGQVNAQNDVQHSQWGVNDALFGAKEAQEQLTVAQESAVLAQRSLNDAYKDAGRQVRDMNSALEDAKLNQEGAALSVAEARQNLMQVMMDPNASLVERQRAQWDVRYANQRYTESKNKTADQAVDTQISNDRGVTGSTQVLEATRGMQSATMAVEQAAHGVVDAQHQVIESLQQVVNAVTNMQLAQNALQLAMNPQPIDQYNIALSKLGPSARDFVEHMQAMRPEVEALERSVSDQLFNGLSGSLDTFVNHQGIAISGAMTGIAQALNTGIKNTLSSLDELFTKMQRNGTWDAFVKGAEDMAKGMAPIITGLVDLFVELGAKTGPIIGPLMNQLGQSLQQLAPALGDLAAAFGKGLLDALPSLTTMLTALAKSFTDSHMMDALSRVFQDVANIITEIAPDIGPLVAALATDFSKFLEGLDKSGGVKNLADEFVQLAQDVQPLMEPMGHFVGDVLPGLLGNIIWLIPKIEELAPKFKEWFDKAKPVLDTIGHLMDDLPGLAGGIENSLTPINNIADAFSGVFGWVDKLVGRIGDFLEAMGHLMDVSSGGHGVGGFLGSFFGGIGSFFSGHAGGGPISGPGTGTSDSIPAMLSDGEYVINAKSAGQHRPLLDAINYGMPGFAVGGIVTGAALASEAHSGKYGRAVRKIAEKSIPGFATGGPVNAKDWGTSHPNIPYVWGGSDAQGADCSGYVGDLQQVAMGVGNPVARLGVTGDVVAGTWPRLIKGASDSDAFIIGANSTHMAARILGMNFEARQPGEMVRIGSAAASPFDGQFTVVGHVDPQAFQPAYNADDGNGDSTNSDASDTDKVAGESSMKVPDVPGTWSEWAGKNTTAAIMSMAAFGSVMPPGPDDKDAQKRGPMAGLQHAMTQQVQNNPDEQQRSWWSKFFFGTATPPPDPFTPAPDPNADPNAAGTSTPANPDAGTKNAPDKLGTDPIAGEGGGPGALGAIQKGVGGFAKAAGEFVSGQLSSALNVLGGSQLDQVPGWVKGGYQAYVLTHQPPDQTDKDKDKDKKKDDAKPAKPDAAAPKPDYQPTPGTPDAPLNKMAHPQSGTEAPQTGNSGDQLNKMAGAGTAAGGVPPLISYTPGGGTRQWTSTFAGVLSSLGMPSSWLQLGMAQMETEDASGDPRAINLDDSNAAKGTPSKGLMQVIDPTFAMVFPKFSSLGYPNDIWDPRSNIAAGLEWEVQKNGSPIGDWGQGHGYATGGEVSGDGSGIGDMIPAMLSDGEFVVNARSADLYKPLLHAINGDHSTLGQLALKQVMPSKALAGVGVSRGGVDNSSTIHVHTNDVEEGFRRASVYQAQKAATYLGRWR